VLQTPDGSFLDVTRNAYDLLRSCGIIMPEVSNISFQWYLFEVLVSSVTNRRVVKPNLPCFESHFRLLEKRLSIFVGKQMLGNHCYVDTGPPFIVLQHPALGPLWDVIRQKVQLYVSSCSY